MNHKMFFIIKLIFLTAVIKLSITHISFINPYAIALSDGKLLVIHRYGVSICNSQVTEIIDTIISFTGDEEISTEEALSKITAVSENGYIFCIINDKTYIFDENGNLLSLNSPKILTDEITDYYYIIFYFFHFFKI